MKALVIFCLILAAACSDELTTSSSPLAASFADVKKGLAAPAAPRSATAFLADGHDHAVLVFRSRSLFREHINGEFPRIVWSRGRLVFTLVGNPTAPAAVRETVEMQEVVARAFRYHSLTFDGVAEPKPDAIADQCEGCHQDMAIWANYALWSGNAGGFHDKGIFADGAGEDVALPQEELLKDLCQRVIDGHKDDELERYRLVLDTRTTSEACVASYLAADPNANLNMLLDTLRLEKIARDIETLEHHPALMYLMAAGTMKQVTEQTWKDFLPKRFREQHERRYGERILPSARRKHADLLEAVLIDTRENLVAEHTERVFAFAEDNPTLKARILAAYEPIKESESRPDYDTLYNFSLERLHAIALYRYLFEPCLNVKGWASSRAPGSYSYAFLNHPRRDPHRVLMAEVFGLDQPVARLGRIRFTEFAAESQAALTAVEDLCKLTSAAPEDAGASPASR